VKKRNARALPVEKLLHNRYIVGRVLGIGGFGITYVVYDIEKKERMAMKEYFPTEWAMRMSGDCSIVPNSQSKEALYHHGQEVFMNEARVLSRLRDIPNVVNVKDFFVENGTAYMVMELLDGYTLGGYLKVRGIKNLPYENANNITRQVGNALVQVHEHMLLHRDVGPDNIMLTRSGDICLIDFGATRMYALNSPTSMSVLVKPGFAPIEQYSRAGNQGPWTDVYALAATYYYLVTGKKPPEAPDRIAGVKVTPLTQLVPGLPQNISDAVNHALAEDWRQRPHNVQVFLTEMGLVDRQNNGRMWQPEGGDSEEQDVPGKKPCVLMQVGNQRRRYYFMQDNTLVVGRTEKQCNIVIAQDNQVSGQHFKLWYDWRRERFTVENYSANRTYTSQGVLEKNQGTYLMKGEWLYIQTVKERYIFYLEVE
jgi:serine/threonine protein kinase